MFEIGFFGTKAPLFMDVITLYFAFLPFLMGFAIMMAVKKRYDLHFKMQMAIYIATISVVVIFEIGVRLFGGFNAFMHESNANYTFMLTFLIIHIIIALLSVVLYTILMHSAVKKYKLHSKPFISSHKKFGIITYLGMSITSITGVLIYYFLFIF